MMIMNRREEDYLKFKWSELKENNGPLINPLTCLHPLHFRYLFLSGGRKYFKRGATYNRLALSNIHIDP
jgi:hypothetical protein